jgi:hypothetical protein
MPPDDVILRREYSMNIKQDTNLDISTIIANLTRRIFVYDRGRGSFADAQDDSLGGRRWIKNSSLNINNLAA